MSTCNAHCSRIYLPSPEWKSRRKNENKQEELDSDDDEDEHEDRLDPLKLMAYHSSCVKKPAQAQNGKRLVVIVKHVLYLSPS